MKPPSELHWPGALLAMLSLVGHAAASDWPQFRGPTGQGATAQKGLPLTWSTDKNIVWKAKLPGPGWSSPIVVGEKIFLTCYSGFMVPRQALGKMDDLKRQVVCLERATGKQLWATEVASRLPEQKSMRESHGFASSTPVADAERVYTFFGKSGVFAFDHAGKQLWHADVGAKIDGFGSAAPLTLYGDLLLVNASIESQSLVALDKKTGKVVWRAGGIHESWHLPLIVQVKGKTEIVLATSGKVVGIDPKSGEQLWSCRTDIGWYMVPTPVIHDGVVYYLGGRSGVVGGAVRAGGRGDVTKTHRLWTTTKASNVTSPIFYDGRLYWMSDGLGVAYCADAKSGKLIYEERIPGAQQVYASPILCEGRIYYTDRGGRTFVVAAQPEFKLLATNTLDKRINVNASVAVAQTRILLRADSVLYCIGER